MSEIAECPFCQEYGCHAYLDRLGISQVKCDNACGYASKKYANRSDAIAAHDRVAEAAGARVVEVAKLHDCPFWIYDDGNVFCHHPHKDTYCSKHDIPRLVPAARRPRARAAGGSS